MLLGLAGQTEPDESISVKMNRTPKIPGRAQTKARGPCPKILPILIIFDLICVFNRNGDK